MNTQISILYFLNTCKIDYSLSLSLCHYTGLQGKKAKNINVNERGLKIHKDRHICGADSDESLEI